MNNIPLIKQEDIEMVLLGFLSEKPMHGYELFKEIANPLGIGQVYRIKIGNMYSILKKLKIRKLVVSKVKRVGNRPPRNLYEVTKNGKIEFNDWMDTPINHGRDFRILFLLKIYFSNRSKSFDGKNLIFKQSQECRNWENRILASNNDLESLNSYQRIVIQYRLSQIKAYSNWLDWCKGVI